LLALVLAGVLLARPSSSPEPATAPQKKTAKHATTAKQATTAQQSTTTATTNATPPPTTTAPTPQPVAAGPHTLNDQAWRLMQQGRYSEAEPLLEKAVAGLAGVGPADPAEGYANYNLGYTLVQLGRCSEGQTYLERAQTLEPDRKEVHKALDEAKHCVDEQTKGKPKKPH
jgi:TolA-binding protein